MKALYPSTLFTFGRSLRLVVQPQVVFSDDCSLPRFSSRYWFTTLCPHLFTHTPRGGALAPLPDRWRMISHCLSN